MTDLTGRALYPINEVLDPSVIPFGDLIPVDQFSTLLESVFAASSSHYFDGENLVIEMELAIEGGLELQLPGNVVSLVLASGGVSWTDVHAVAGIGPDPWLTILELTAGLRFADNVLADVETGAPAEVEIAGDVTLSASGGIGISNPQGLALRPAFVAGSPIVVEAADIRPVFSADEAPPQAADIADPKGLAIEVLAVSVPVEYLTGGEEDEALRFEVASAWIDRNGFTGEVAVESANLDDPITGKVLGLPYVFRFFRLAIDQNSLDEAALGVTVEFNVPSSAGDDTPDRKAIALDLAFGIGESMSLALSATQPVGETDDPAHLVSFRIGSAVLLAIDGVAGEVARDSWSVQVDVATEITINGSGGDSFIASLLGDGATVPEVELGLIISPTGVALAAGTAVDLRIPLAIHIGPLSISALQLGVSSSGENDVVASAGVDLATDLGIVKFSASGVGVEVSFIKDPDTELGIRPRFRPPLGIGLAVGTVDGPVSGGGYLFLDPETGRYSAVVDLQIIKVGITAFVLIDTAAPDIDGWSMFFALFIEIPQIQLGFGFSLNGVGGLAGINRTIDAEALGSAVRSGSLSSILFPEDPIVDAPIIISELEAIFPPANDSYVFGPVVKIGWGTPPIVEAELGIVIAFGPDGVVIAVLGSVTAILPRPELELIALRLDLAGVIDTGRGTISLDASLHDSHIIGFALAGDMALRANFSDSRSFLFSVGGFHPAFTPPAGFPALARMSLGVSAGSVIEVSFTCYFAITSNTVQFGAALELWAKASGFEIAGGASFDALIKFSPFELQTNIAMYVSVKAVGVDLLGIFLSASLTGPSPWHVVGTAEFKVLGVSTDIRVDKTIGARTPQPPPPAAPDLLALLADELARADNWSVVSTTAAGVVFADRSPVVGADADEVAPLLARPDSTIQVSQTVLPLGVQLDKYANTSIGEHNHFGVTASGGLVAAGEATEWFAPAQFFDIKPKERLSRPSFEQFEAGIEFGSDRVEAGRSVELLDGHAEFRIDPEFVGEPEEHTSTRSVQIPAVELGVERVNAFVIAGAPRFDLVASPTFTSQMEFA
jgi:hypothetical protein